MDISSPNLMLHMGSGAVGEHAGANGKGKGKSGKCPGPKMPLANLKSAVKVEPTDLETWSALGC